MSQQDYLNSIRNQDSFTFEDYSEQLRDNPHLCEELSIIYFERQESEQTSTGEVWFFCLTKISSNPEFSGSASKTWNFKPTLLLHTNFHWPFLQSQEFFTCFLNSSWWYLARFISFGVACAALLDWQTSLKSFFIFWLTEFCNVQVDYCCPHYPASW